MHINCFNDRKINKKNPIFKAILVSAFSALVPCAYPHAIKINIDSGMAIAATPETRLPLILKNQSQIISQSFTNNFPL
jgi:hypothetical protein